jgi:polar amino acid transport system permease protein
VIPPLLNDFISLTKDVALVSVVGPQEAFRVAQIYAAQNFNYTPLLSAAFLLCDDPADASHRLPAGAQSA